MTRIAELPGNARPRRGYLAPCPRCGALVVHGATTGEPSHAHLRGRRCDETARARGATPSTPSPPAVTASREPTR